MSKQGTFTIIKDTFGKEGSEENVNGLTLIVDGKVKKVFDTIILKSDKHENYTDVFRGVIIQGVNAIINDLK